MQELEKILEEIDAHAIEFEAFGISDDYISAGWAKEIIRKHMNEDNDIVEQCPHCGNELALHWNVEKDGYEVYCPYCGFPVMLCSMCDTRDGKVCDWTENVGCKHSSERYRDYFGKHMNDGWIQVKERLPKAPEMEDEYPEFNVMIEGAKTPTTLQYTHEGIWVDDYGNAYDVIAWQPLPEPYIPKTQNKPEEHYPEWRTKFLNKFDRRL